MSIEKVPLVLMLKALWPLLIVKEFGVKTQSAEAEDADTTMAVNVESI